MRKGFEHTMRWYGPNDPVKLADIGQAGATGIVTALHHIPNGAVWSVEEIEKRIRVVEEKELKWSVVESLPVSEDIKMRNGHFQEHIENYKQSLRHLAQCNIKTVCYNFMPLLDWTRTQLDFQLPNGAKALRYEKYAVLAFDLFILQRKNAKADYSKIEIEEAKDYFEGLNAEEKQLISDNILKGLPGSEVGFELESFRKLVAQYDEIDAEKLADNLRQFLHEVIPTAKEVGINLCIHPDDPPFPIFGLPRIVSTAADIRRIFSDPNEPNNGLTFCTGSFGVRMDNDLPAMVEEFGDRIHFVHLRATKRDSSGNFYEADHLFGDVPMYEVVKNLIDEQHKRKVQLPMRPDHGHQMLDDLEKRTYPGYTAIGRLKGLAELRGLEFAILKFFENQTSRE